MASVVVNIISTANNSGFTKATRSLTKLTAAATAVTAATGVAGGAVGALGVGLAGVGALATPALAAVVVGMDGIKKAAEGAKPGSVLARLRQARMRRVGWIEITPSAAKARIFAQNTGLPI